MSFYKTNSNIQKDAQLVQLEKLATLGELATGIAHEINQPLGGISLMAQGLLLAKSHDKLNDALLTEKLNSIIEQVERINIIITHLRTFARQSNNVNEEVDVKKPILDVFKLIGQQLVKMEILVTLDISDDLNPILGDHNKLEQILLNLISNARDAIEDLGKLQFDLKTTSHILKSTKKQCKEIAIKAYNDKSMVVIEVIDTGAGIPENIKNKIFEPFFTTKEVGKGTGLGLSITYGLIKEFDGIIHVESQEMKGSKFTIKFPAVNKQGS